MKTKLTPLAARADLTDRECCKAIGGLIGGLIELSTVENVRNAVKWWAEHDQGWDAFTQFMEARKKLQTPPAPEIHRKAAEK